jgi:hypothetical protein
MTQRVDPALKPHKSDSCPQILHKKNDFGSSFEDNDGWGKQCLTGRSEPGQMLPRASAFEDICRGSRNAAFSSCSSRVSILKMVFDAANGSA